MSAQRHVFTSGGDRYDRFSLASARVPFGLKVATVWVVIFIVLGLFFAVAQFDVQWMRDQLSYMSAAFATRST